ncbi:MAG TPA: hypothetical protein VGZ22_11465 [Isosphaeraceae bacterium]|jgi:hypothetical protein|nr:hypothetical protein [Isosphaeraceae bacterium]
MTRFRTSILAVMILIAITGIGMAALTHPTATWDAGLLTATAIVLLSAGVAAGLLRGPRRAFWVGFTVFGLGYLLLSASPEIRPRLLTTSALDYLFPMVVRQPDMTPQEVTQLEFARALKRWAEGPANPSSSPALDFTGLYRDFMQIGHTLVALLFAALGGFWAQWFAMRRRARTREAMTRPPGS